MSEDKSRDIIPSREGLFYSLSKRLKLIIRLMADRRVNPLLKLLPIGAIVYIVVPDLAIGPLDDVAVIWLGTYLFVELCPPDVVAEHMRALGMTPPEEAGAGEEPTGDVIDAEYWEKKE